MKEEFDFEKFEEAAIERRQGEMAFRRLKGYLLPVVEGVPGFMLFLK